MIRSLYLVMVYLAMLGMGCAAPFVFTLGYVWVDLFSPQAVAYIILNRIPCALVMGVAAFGSYFLMDRRSPPRLNVTCVLLLMLAGWCTLTLVWAEVPDAAWEKWNWAFKTVVFSAFIPFVIRSRVQIEAFILVYVFSLAANLVPFGLKTAISGGGYGRSLGLLAENAGLGEGALLATAAVSTLPLIFYAMKHTLLLPKHIFSKLMLLGVAGTALFTTIGTYERTGLVGIGVFGIGFFLQTKRKVLTACVGAVGLLFMVYHTSAAWNERMDTIKSFDSESSALGRILVWQWTLKYTASHPLGGGFEAYRIDRIEFPDGEVVFGKAFHSMYFEALGEQGWVGLAIYLSVIAASLLQLRRVRRYAKGKPELAWCYDLASNLLVMLAVLLVCGSFIAVAFRGMNLYTFAVIASLSEYVRRLEQADKKLPQRLVGRPVGFAAAPVPGLRVGVLPHRRQHI